MSRVSKVWQYLKISNIGYESCCKTMAIYRLRNRSNRPDFPSSSKGHKFVLVAIDYFTKWVEAIPLKITSSTNVIDFISEHIIYRFGVPQSITTH